MAGRRRSSPAATLSDVWWFAQGAGVIATVVGAVGTWIVHKRWRLGWWLGALSGASWIFADICIRFWGSVPAGVVMLVLAARNVQKSPAPTPRAGDLRST